MSKWRFILLLGGFLILFGILEFKLYDLQISKGEYYSDKAEVLGGIKENLSLRRGQIFITDRSGNKIPAAINKDFPIIYAVPKEIDDPQEASEHLAEALGWEKEALEEVLDKPRSLFRLLVEKADEEVIKSVREIDLAGIYVDEKQYRFYPFESLAAHLLGFVGINKDNHIPIGLYGVEKEFNRELAEGEDITLTIDRNIQAQSEKILKELVENFNAAGGTIIVQDPVTGKILAMASAPTFDPSIYGDFPLEAFPNPALQSIYEAGSVFKPLTMAAGIDSGSITPDSKYYDTGSVTINGETIRNWDLKGHGWVTMTNVLEQSINTGAVFAAKETGRKKFLEYMKKLGFGKVSGLNLPEEVEGSLRNIERRDSQDIDLASASFGQGTAVTPVQLVGAYSTLANKGIRMRPYIEERRGKKKEGRILKESTAIQVTRMLESAVEKAYVAALPNFRIAGKTGTAQIADLVYGGYTDQFIHSYIGFGPASNPRFTALIKLDKPEAELAGRTVVPAFRELAQFILSYYNVPPDKPTP